MLGDSAVVARAFGYPYYRPAASFLFESPASVRPLTMERSGLAGRSPVLAVGSNASLVQLNRKFGRKPAQRIPVLAAVLRGYDVVYAARISRYGAIPASLSESAGTRLAVHVMFLTPEQRDILDRSEGGYDSPPGYTPTVVAPERVSCEVEFEDELTAYQATRGLLNLGGGTVALADVPATGRTRRALGEEAVLAAVGKTFGLTAEELVLRAVRDDAFRRRVLAVLAREAIAADDHVTHGKNVVVPE